MIKTPIVNPRCANDIVNNFQTKQVNNPSPQAAIKHLPTTPKTVVTNTTPSSQQPYVLNLKQTKSKPSPISSANASPPKSTFYINNSSSSSNNLNSGEDINTLPSVQERIEQFQQISNQRQQQRQVALNAAMSNQTPTSATNTPTLSNNLNSNKLFNRASNNTPTSSINTINGSTPINSLNEQKEGSPRVIKLLTNNTFSSSNDNLTNLNSNNNNNNNNISNVEPSLVRQNIQQSQNAALNRLNILQQQQQQQNQYQQQTQIPIHSYSNNLKEIQTPSSLASTTSSASSPQTNLKAIRQVTINSTNGSVNSSNNNAVLETVLKGNFYVLVSTFVQCFFRF
jgi:hypothetical protein